MGNSKPFTTNNLTESEGTKIILALFAGITAGAVLTALLVSSQKGNLIQRLIPSFGKNNNDQAFLEASLPHPEKYLEGEKDIIIQPT